MNRDNVFKLSNPNVRAAAISAFLLVVFIGCNIILLTFPCGGDQLFEGKCSESCCAYIRSGGLDNMVFVGASVPFGAVQYLPNLNTLKQNLC